MRVMRHTLLLLVSDRPERAQGLTSNHSMLLLPCLCSSLRCHMRPLALPLLAAYTSITRTPDCKFAAFKFTTLVFPVASAPLTRAVSLHDPPPCRPAPWRETTATAATKMLSCRVLVSSRTSVKAKKWLQKLPIPPREKTSLRLVVVHSRAWVGTSFLCCHRHFADSVTCISCDLWPLRTC